MHTEFVRQWPNSSQWLSTSFPTVSKYNEEIHILHMLVHCKLMSFVLDLHVKILKSYGCNGGGISLLTASFLDAEHNINTAFLNLHGKS